MVHLYGSKPSVPTQYSDTEFVGIRFKKFIPWSARNCSGTLYSYTEVCKFWGFCSSLGEEYILLGYNAVSLGNRFRTSRGNGLPSSVEMSSVFLDIPLVWLLEWLSVSHNLVPCEVRAGAVDTVENRAYNTRQSNQMTTFRQMRLRIKKWPMKDTVK